VPSQARRRGARTSKHPAQRVGCKTVVFKRLPAPRLRFDRSAIGLIERLQADLAAVVEEGKVVVVTITAPIRQDSKTGAILEAKVRELLARRRVQLGIEIHGNDIRVRVLKGGHRRTPRVIGFAHNPEPSPAALFDVARRLLASAGFSPEKGSCARARWLIVANQDGRAPLDTIRRVCTALRLRRVFNRILVSESDGLKAL